jgi:hypothetical protein
LRIHLEEANAVIPTPPFSTLAYVVGEEVVVTLGDGIKVFNLDHLTVMPPALLPGWTIGRIVALETSGSLPAYVLRMRLRGMQCVLVAPPTAIEGVA